MCDEVTGKFGIELAPELRLFVLRQNGDNFYAETLSFAIEINGIFIENFSNKEIYVSVLIRIVFQM